MQKEDLITGFSRLCTEEKTELIAKLYTNDANRAKQIIGRYRSKSKKIQRLHDGFSENTLANYYLPFGIAPNFLINGRLYAIPMVTEESSVIAAASKAAALWALKGGFKCTALGTLKKGQLHLNYTGRPAKLKKFFEQNKQALCESCRELNKNMIKRGGGLIDIRLTDKRKELPDYFQIDADFQTLDAMGANFINSNLEQLAVTLTGLYPDKGELEVTMGILSNYTPECLSRAELRCKVSDLGEGFARKFVRAVEIASADVDRAVTHNKGIMNGVDALVMASGNDFRAVEASCHAYAAKDGQYRSLSKAEIIGDEFIFSLELPLSLGTVGGLTKLHPLAALSLEILGNPSAAELGQIVTALGLAQNYAAVSALIDGGIQKGHMKMHLNNILLSMKASEKQKQAAQEYFKDKKISTTAVKEFLS